MQNFLSRWRQAHCRFASAQIFLHSEQEQRLRNLARLQPCSVCNGIRAFWIPCHNFFVAPQIKVDDWVKRLEVGELQLDVGVVVVLSVPEIDQIVQNPQSEVVLVFSL
ncbi:MAG: hypothetical protein OIF58_04690, partial [Cohaesibacter sp.]|nr:hypothetical protein [Cohaesibacter sp.]